MEQLKLIIRVSPDETLTVLESASLVSISLFDPLLKSNFNDWFDRYYKNSTLLLDKSPFSFGIIVIDFITNTIYSCQDYEELKSLSLSNIDFYFQFPLKFFNDKKTDNFKINSIHLSDYLFNQTGYKKKKKLFYYFTKEYFDITNYGYNDFVDLIEEIYYDKKTTQYTLRSLKNERLYIGNFYLCYRHDFTIKELCCETNDLLKLYITLKNIGLSFSNEENTNWIKYIDIISKHGGYSYSKSLYNKLIIKSGLK